MKHGASDRSAWLAGVITICCISLSALCQKPPAPPTASAITDPAQITSKQKFDIQPLTVEKLYMTRAVGDSSWSPDDKQVAFVSNMSGRNNIWLVPSQGGWPMQLTVSSQRQLNFAWSPKGRWIA